VPSFNWVEAMLPSVAARLPLGDARQQGGTVVGDVRTLE
jgi:hypothetical protein